MTKAELLESGDADVAVRLALGEAQIIAETKAQLEEAGADVGRRSSAPPPRAAPRRRRARAPPPFGARGARFC